MTLDQLLSKAFNGKAENIVISKNIIMFHLDGVETRINLVSFIDQIYNDHEAQLKLASDVYSTDKMHMYQELKAKDDEIRRLNNLYADTIRDLGDALIEIERLKEHITHLQNVYMKLDGKYLKLKTELEELKDDK